MVKCNNCENEWHEDSLWLLRDGQDWMKACPVCKTDEFLTDTEE